MKSPGGSRTRALVGVSAATVVALVGWGGYFWLTHDNTMGGTGAEVGMLTPVGHTTYFGLGAFPRTAHPEESRRIDLRGVVPRITSNSADAAIEVLICADSGLPETLLELSAVRDDVSRYCKSLEALHAGSVDLGPRASGLILAITPHRVGEVRVEGVDISYRHGIRRGQVHSGITTTVATE